MNKKSVICSYPAIVEALHSYLRINVITVPFPLLNDLHLDPMYILGQYSTI